MGNVTWVAVLSGPLVLAAYLAGAASRGPDRRGLATLLEAVVPLVAATLAWHLVRAVAPGTQFSRVASLSNQVITVWESVALWVGLAAVVGQVAPLWARRRGGSGVGPALVLAFAYAPMVFAAAVAGFFGGLLVLGGRPRAAWMVGLGVAITFEWLAWVLEWQGGWGAVNGPELSLWVTVVAGVLAARALGGEGPLMTARRHTS